MMPIEKPISICQAWCLTLLVASCSREAIPSFSIEDTYGTLNVMTEPLGFSFVDGTGRVLLETAAGEGGRSFLSFGTYDSLKFSHFYDPSNTQEAPFGARWKFAGNAVSKEEIPGGWRLSVTVEKEVGEKLLLDILTEEDVGFKFTATIVAPAAVAFFRLTFTAALGEHYYGLGERFDRTDAAGGAYQMFTAPSGQFTSSTNEVHVPVPFFVSKTPILPIST